MSGFHAMRKSGIFIIFTTAGILIFLLLLVGHPHMTGAYYRNNQQEKALLVKKLALTDLCLFTEAPYTRHLSQADNFSAFKDSPLVFEHYPSGSLTLPPQLVRTGVYGDP